MPDKTLTCRNCSQPFTFSMRDQEFFEQKGFSQPSRCRSCNQARKGNSAPANNNTTRTMFTAYCKGGDHTVELPFQPEQSKPFNCRDHKPAPREMHDAYCVAGSHTVRVPFVPRVGQDFYCRDHPQPKFSAYCKGGDHTVEGLTREPDSNRPFNCRDHKPAPKTMYDVYCAGGSHMTKVPFEPKTDRDFYCREHQRPTYSAWCDGGGHMVEKLPFEPDSTRDFFCRDHPRPRGGGYQGGGGQQNSGLGLTFRSDTRGNSTGSSRRVAGTNLSFNSDRRGNSTGSSERIPGLGLTFHRDKNGNSTGVSRHIPGIGTFTDGKNGKMKSFTDNRGFRSGPGGKSKGSSRRI